MDASEKLAPEVGTAAACRAMGVARATLYRRRNPSRPKKDDPRNRRQPRALDEPERREVLHLLHSPRFVDKAPATVYATLLDEGRYHCSIRTMYRILHDAREVRERRNQLRHPKYKKPELLFLAMLPTITRVARESLSNLTPEAREEATAEVIAAAFIMFVRLVEQGREALAYPSVLGAYGVKRVRIGRMAATPQNCRDVSSTFCQLTKGVSIERVDRFDKEDNAWQEVVVQDKHATPADVAAARIDIAAWLKSLPRRTRRIAKALAAGETTGKVARMFNLSAGRISQLRRELMRSWLDFQGEAVPASA